MESKLIEGRARYVLYPLVVTTYFKDRWCNMYLKTLFLGILMLFTSCFAEPLHTVEASIISTSQEVSMGADVAKKLEKQYGVVDDAYLQARVDRIGQSLVAVCDRKNIKYSFKVLNTKDVNALAVPGGYIY